MGTLDEGYCNGDVEGCIKLGLEKEAETAAIEDTVKALKVLKVLLQGLGEDINREDLLKTPLRVAKVLREGTRGVCIGGKRQRGSVCSLTQFFLATSYLRGRRHNEEEIEDVGRTGEADKAGDGETLMKRLSWKAIPPLCSPISTYAVFS